MTFIQIPQRKPCVKVAAMLLMFSTTRSFGKQFCVQVLGEAIAAIHFEIVCKIMPKHAVAPLRSAPSILKLRNDHLLAEAILTDTYLNPDFSHPRENHRLISCNAAPRSPIRNPRPPSLHEVGLGSATCSFKLLRYTPTTS